MAIEKDQVVAIQDPSTRGRILSVGEGTVLLKHSLLDSEYLERISNSRELVNNEGDSISNVGFKSTRIASQPTQYDGAISPRKY